MTGVLLGGIALLPLLASDGPAPREVVIVARGMSFHVPADAERPNPTIRVEPGEELRFVFRNEDAGFEHDFNVSDWGLSIAPLRSGTSSAAVVRAPEQPGRADYVCTLHAVMMKGTIEVAAH